MSQGTGALTAVCRQCIHIKRGTRLTMYSAEKHSGCVRLNASERALR